MQNTDQINSCILLIDAKDELVIDAGVNTTTKLIYNDVKPTALSRMTQPRNIMAFVAQSKE